jgi:cytochrome P450|uniref:Cytochrome P450 n=1 Tax=Phaeodactylum tricornutum TaxID=2850 RepID=A0A8J9X3G0_PHATR
MILYVDEASNLDPWWQTTALAIVVLGIAYAFTRRRSFQRKDGKQYPPYAPIGLLRTILSMSGPKAPSFMLEMSRLLKCSVFRVRLPIPGTPMVVAVGEPILTKLILTESRMKPASVYKPFESVTKGPSIFTETDETTWKHARKGVAPAFSSQHIRRMNTICAAHTERWIQERLVPSIANNAVLDIATEMVDLTVTVICESAFEYNPSKEEMTMFLSELDLALREFSFKQSANPLRKFFNGVLPSARRAKVASDRLQRFVFKVMDHYRSLKHHETEDTVIGRIMNNDKYKNDEARAADLLTFLVAGHDTTGYSLAWILLHLAQHPHEQKILREKLQATPREEWAQSAGLRSVVQEGMRLSPVAAMGSVRQLAEDIVSPTDPTIVLPKGAIVFLPQILACRNPDVFDSPDEFQPSRWDEPSELQRAAIIPFSLGPRNCVGQRLAVAELHSVIASVCAKYTFTVEDEGTSDYFLTYKPVGALLKATHVPNQ